MSIIIFITLSGVSFNETMSDGEQRKMTLSLAENMMKSPKREFQDVTPITGAFVPIVKFRHRKLNLNCDLSFRSGINILNSMLVK
jgi:DNA polymerase sigma